MELRRARLAAWKQASNDEIVRAVDGAIQQKLAAAGSEAEVQAAQLWSGNIAAKKQTLCYVLQEECHQP